MTDPVTPRPTEEIRADEEKPRSDDAIRDDLSWRPFDLDSKAQRQRNVRFAADVESLLAERDALAASLVAAEARADDWKSQYMLAIEEGQEQIRLRDEARARVAQLEGEQDELRASLTERWARAKTAEARMVAAEAREGLLLAERDPAVLDEVRALWQAALEREGNLASAVADVVWKATQFGTTHDGDTFAYIVPKGAMHRLVGVAQSNGAHVPVAFRAALAAASPPEDPNPDPPTTED